VRRPAQNDWANLNFLGEPAMLLANLKPDENGVVRVDRKGLGAHQHVRILAVDPQDTAYREVTLPEPQVKYGDLTLPRGLDPDTHYTEQKRISVVKGGDAFRLDDITTSKIEAYDTLAKVYRLYATLNPNPTLAEFAFVLRWPQMKTEEKREKYSKYACHELHFFLYRRDPAFFEEVVLPYLRNKKDKTFMDLYLLEADLSGFTKPWPFAQLNFVERVLLARRIAEQQERVGRHVKDRYDLLPPDIERFNHLFRTALKGSALDTDDGLGLELARADRLKELSQAQTEVAADEVAVTAEGVVRGPAVRKPKAPSTPARRARAMGKKAKAEPRQEAEEKEKLAKDMDLSDLAAGTIAGRDGKYWAGDKRRREAARQFYRKMPKTKEWAENNYYHVPIERQNAGLIPVSAFWRDYAKHDGKGPFFSTNLAEASRSFHEMMLALAVLDLPFEAKEHETAYEKVKMTLRTGSPMVVFHREIREAEAMKEKTPILVSQNFFRLGDRYRHVNNERFDKYVTEEFLQYAVYGCQVVLTNPTSSRQKLDVLLQVPRGGIPVKSGFTRRSRSSTTSTSRAPAGTCITPCTWASTRSWRRSPRRSR
jgi:hypothetical protein